MNIDITPYIKELLFEHNNMVIPGFGALTLKYAPSTIDHVQGLLNPPTKSIAFDKNLVVNDGKLINIIQEKHKVSAEEATNQINKYVKIIKDQIDRREMVNILGVGRLYKDFENNIQFIPDTTNFNKEAFGLPTVNFFPLLRDEATPETIVPSGSTTRRYEPKYKKSENTPSLLERIQSLFQEHSWLPIALIAVGLIALGSYLMPKFLTSSSSPITEKLVNQSPAEEVVSAVTDQEDVIQDEEEYDEQEDIDDFEADAATASVEHEGIPDTDGITVNPNQRLCVVSVGVFGSKANAQKRIEEVYAYGFDALPEKYMKNGKELTKVAIQFGFETEAEFKKQIKEIKKRFKKAVVMRKE